MYEIIQVIIKTYTFVTKKNQNRAACYIKMIGISQMHLLRYAYFSGLQQLHHFNTSKDYEKRLGY